MANVVVLDCGSGLMRSMLDTLYALRQTPIVVPSGTTLSDITKLNPCGLIISGSPLYVNDPTSPRVDRSIYSSGIPILGVCYGMQLMAVDLGGQVKRMKKPEQELIEIRFVGQESILYRDFSDDGAPVWMLHTCKVTRPPPGFIVTSCSKMTEITSMECPQRGLYAVQFHPEHLGKDPSVQAGTAIIWSFLNGVCGA